MKTPMNDKDSILIMPGSNLITTTRPFQDVAEIGPYKINDVVPWRGMNLVVAKIVSNGQSFQLVLAPIGLTSGYMKRAKGKKGRRDGRHGSVVQN